jgi:hypothetical protein
VAVSADWRVGGGADSDEKNVIRLKRKKCVEKDIPHDPFVLVRNFDPWLLYCNCTF